MQYEPGESQGGRVRTIGSDWGSGRVLGIHRPRRSVRVRCQRSRELDSLTGREKDCGCVKYNVQPEIQRNKYKGISWLCV